MIRKFRRNFSILRNHAPNCVLYQWPYASTGSLERNFDLDCNMPATVGHLLYQIHVSRYQNYNGDSSACYYPSAYESFRP